MLPDEIGRSYDNIAAEWLKPQLQSNGIHQHERAIQFCKKRRYALDIGCGCSGRFIDLVVRHGFCAEGLDVSEQMIALARRRHPHVSFHHADICQWEFPRRYDFVSAWDSIWHLPLEQQEPILGKICEALTPSGVLIFTTAGLDASEEKWDSSMGTPVYYSALGIPKTLDVLSRWGCVCRHLEYDQYPETHVYIIAQRNEHDHKRAPCFESESSE